MSRSRLAWLKLRKKTAPELPFEPPIFLGNKSNGEFFHTQTPAERKIRAEILRQCDDKARKLGIDRREFIASAMGMCTSLSVLNLAAGCGDRRGHMPLSMADPIMNPSVASSTGGQGGIGAGGSAQSSTSGTGGQSRPMAVGPKAGSGGTAGGMASRADAGGMSARPDGHCAPACVSRGQPDGGFCIPHQATLDCDIIYHSAYGLGNTEGPYDPNGQGVDRLVKTVEDNKLKDKNVYAEMGSAWLLASGDPMGAQHYVGKMLKHIGTERLLWGSECVWFGSPQRQIEAFRTFTISKEFQDMYGYPELTPELKANIFGLNAAKLYCVDPSACRYEVDQSLLAQKKRQLDGELGDRRWAFERPAIKTRREFVTLIKRRRALGELG